MLRGVVKVFDMIYGCGLISPEDGSPDVYIHYSALGDDGFQELQVGQRVSFERAENSTSRFARNIQVLDQQDDLIPA